MKRYPALRILISLYKVFTAILAIGMIGFTILAFTFNDILGLVVGFFSFIVLVVVYASGELLDVTLSIEGNLQESVNIQQQLLQLQLLQLQLNTTLSTENVSSMINSQKSVQPTDFIDNLYPDLEKRPSISLTPGWIAIPNTDYSIAKYPITNAQFRKFIEADGYKTDKWWTEEGLKYRNDEKWTEPRFWTDSMWNGDTQPVVGISWFEAVAFCLWLSDVTGEKIMLPTEGQWQYAAQGDDGRDYPWGNDWNRDLCNNNEGKRGVGKTTSVAQYEGKGDSPFGVVDMAGNVWEWCLTDYETGNNDIESSAESRVLRGGSWIDDFPPNFRASNRSGNFPGNYDSYGGFRIARFN